MKQPNLLFMFSDQHRAQAMGCYGSEYVRSPHLDRLAAGGVKFQSCISNIPVCVPARGTLLTGLMPWNHGALANDLPVRTDIQSIAHVLTAAGYEVGYIGKWHLGGVPRDKPIHAEARLGFQHWRVANCTHDYFNSYYDDEKNQRHYYSGHESIGQTDLAIQFIQERAKSSNREKPWALFISWGIPHDPYHLAPEAYRNSINATSISLQPNVPSTIQQTSTISRTRDEIVNWIRGYTALIHLLDDQVGRLADCLEQSGLSGETLTVYTSDHGDMLGSQGLTHKQLPFEEAIHVPLILSWPEEIKPGTALGLIGLVDLPVTILALLGLSFSGYIDGWDLSNLVYDPQSTGRPSSLICDLVPCHQAADRGHDAWVGVRTPTHTYARWSDGRPYICFNNQKDPFQLENLIAVEPELVGRLDAEVNRILSDYGYNFRPWAAMLKQDGFTQEWNRSQKYFNRSTLA